MSGVVATNTTASAPQKQEASKRNTEDASDTNNAKVASVPSWATSNPFATLRTGATGPSSSSSSPFSGFSWGSKGPKDVVAGDKIIDSTSTASQHMSTSDAHAHSAGKIDSKKATDAKPAGWTGGDPLAAFTSASKPISFSAFASGSSGIMTVHSSSNTIHIAPKLSNSSVGDNAAPTLPAAGGTKRKRSNPADMADFPPHTSAQISTSMHSNNSTNTETPNVDSLGRVDPIAGAGDKGAGNDAASFESEESEGEERVGERRGAERSGEGRGGERRGEESAGEGLSDSDSNIKGGKDLAAPDTDTPVDEDAVEAESGADADGDAAAKPKKKRARIDAATVSTGEEREETAHQVRAKLFVLDKRLADAKWRECGTGPLRINVRKDMAHLLKGAPMDTAAALSTPTVAHAHTDTATEGTDAASAALGPLVRLILRREHKIGGRGTTVLLNAAVWPDMPINPHPSDQMAVQLVAYASEVPKVLLDDATKTDATASARHGPYSFLVKFGKPEQAKEFISKVKNFQLALRKLPASGTFSAAPSETGVAADKPAKIDLSTTST